MLFINNHSEFNQFETFFQKLKKHFQLFKDKKPNILLVSHIIPDKLPFLDFLKKNANLINIIPKPKTIDDKVYQYIRKKFNIKYIHCLRNEIASSKTIIDILKSKKDLIILDVGGYFSTIAGKEDLTKNILGIIEDTENGFQRYIKTYPKIPVIEVARSPLKYPEDLLVGESIVFSTEDVLRKMGEIFTNKTVGIIGFGKIGKNIARILSGRNIRVLVFDKDPIKRIWASAYGYESVDKLTLLRISDIIFCATGNKSLTVKDLNYIKNNLKIASVTSSDDEFDLKGLSDLTKLSFNKEWSIYKTKGGKMFYLLNHGNSINFLHNAVVGKFISLVQAEILVATDYLVKNCQRFNRQILSLPERIRVEIGKLWIEHFL